MNTMIDATTPAPARAYAWKLREIVVAGILSVVCGGIFYGADMLYNVIFSATASPAAGAIMNGVWWLPAGLVPYIIRRPGAAFVGEMVGALVEFALGGPYGILGVVSGLAQGAGAEVGFALFRWRRYNVSVLGLAGALGGVGNVVQWWYQYGGDKLAHSVQLGYTVVTLASGIVLAGIIPKLLGDALNRTGVLRNFAINHQVN